MLNEDRIKIMTELAMFEQGSGKKKLKISGYYRRDYVGLNMITTTLWVLLGYILILLLLGVVFLTQVLAALTIANVIKFIIISLVGFAALLIVYLKMARAHFSRKHRIAKRDVKEYYGKLRGLGRLYAREKAMSAKAADDAGLGGEQ